MFASNGLHCAGEGELSRPGSERGPRPRPRPSPRGEGSRRQLRSAPAGQPGQWGGGRVRSHCRFVRPLTLFTPDSLGDLVPLFLKRRCDRTLGGGRHDEAWWARRDAEGFARALHRFEALPLQARRPWGVGTRHHRRV